MYKLVLLVLTVAAAVYADSAMMKTSAMSPSSMPATYITTMPGMTAASPYSYYPSYQASYAGYPYAGYQNIYSPMTYPMSGYMPMAYGNQYLYSKPASTYTVM